MIRYDGTIYHEAFPDKNAKVDQTIQIRRPEKTSKKRKELRCRRATSQMLLRYSGPDTPKEVVDQCKSNIAHCNHRLSNMKDRSHKIKRTYKKRSFDEIRRYTLAWIDGAKASGERYITAEDIAFHLNVKPHFVKQVLQQLNVEGVVTQRINNPPHDSKRDRWGGNDSSWTASKYYFRNDEEEDEE